MPYGQVAAVYLSLIESLKDFVLSLTNLIVKSKYSCFSCLNR